MEASASGEFVADRRRRCDDGDDRADQIGAVGARPVGRQEALDAGGERVDQVTVPPELAITASVTTEPTIAAAAPSGPDRLRGARPA